MFESCRGRHSHFATARMSDVIENQMSRRDCGCADDIAAGGPAQVTTASGRWSPGWPTLTAGAPRPGSDIPACVLFRQIMSLVLGPAVKTRRQRRIMQLFFEHSLPGH